jgi:hypothetical protein
MAVGLPASVTAGSGASVHGRTLEPRPQEDAARPRPIVEQRRSGRDSRSGDWQC